MRHRRLVGQHPEILSKILLGREVSRYRKLLVGQRDRPHTVKTIGGIMATCKDEQIPPLMEEFEGVGRHHLLIRLSPKTLIAHQDAPATLHGPDDDGQELLTSRHILEDDAVLERDTVGEHTADGKCGEHPTRETVIVEHLRISDVITMTAVAVDDNPKHLEDGITMAVERGARKGIALRHLVLYPQFTEGIKAQSSVASEGIDEPDILLEDQGRFHLIRVLLL